MNIRIDRYGRVEGRETMQGDAGAQAPEEICDGAALYRLLAWMSPAFPIGGFSYSHGLEAAVEEGLVRDAASLEEWVGTILCHGAGRADAVFCARAMERIARDDIDGFVEVAELAAAMRPTAELAMESASQGEAFVGAAATGWPDAKFSELTAVLRELDIPVVHPIAVAAACACASVSVSQSLLAYLHGFASNLVSAAVRLVPLGQSDGLRVLAALEGRIQQIVHEARQADIDDIGTAVPMADWTSMTHETQYTRLFRS